LDVGAKLWEHLKRPFYDNGPNDKGVGIQLAYSIARVAIGYLLAVLVAVPIGFLIGMSPLMTPALHPFIHAAESIPPLAWMPLGPVAIGYLLAVLVAVPIGFLIGMSPLMTRALAPFIQALKPISPLAWMPLALYTIKDSSLSSIFVIFICSLWPMLINTAFGVA